MKRIILLSLALTCVAPLPASAAPPATAAVTGWAGDSVWTCSGALISPTRVVTAGHCLEGRIDGVLVQVGAKRVNPDRGVAARRWRRLRGADVGRIDLPRDDTRAFAERWTSPQDVQPGDRVQVFGYGRGKLTKFGMPVARGVDCRMGVAFDWSEFVCAGNVPDWNGPCAGDSGGPMFWNGAVVAVLSGYAGVEYCGESAFHYTRIDSPRVSAFLSR